MLCFEFSRVLRRYCISARRHGQKQNRHSICRRRGHGERTSKLPNVNTQHTFLLKVTDIFKDLFYGNITNSLTSLVNGVESILLPGLQDMTKRNWSALEHVGDQSRHINVISSTISEFVPSTKGLLSEVYFKTFCDKLAFAFLPKYFHSITQCKLIGDYGSQQLLLDTHALKTIFLQIPSDDRYVKDRRYALTMVT